MAVFILIVPQAAAETWTLDLGHRIQGALPELIRVDDQIRLYFFDGNIKLAESTDGLNFTIRSQNVLSQPAPPGADPSVVRLGDGTFRLYYKTFNGSGSPDQAQHRIHTAHSQDGISFVYDHLVIDTRSDGHHVSVPDAIVLPDGHVRLYYVSEEHIKSHVSTDASGTEFIEEPGRRVADHWDPSLGWINGEVRMFMSGPSDARPRGLTTKLYSSASPDGLNFTQPTLIYGDPSTDLADPGWVKLPDGRLRIYFWSFKDQPPVIYSLTRATDMVPDASAATPPSEGGHTETTATPGLAFALALMGILMALRRR